MLIDTNSMISMTDANQNFSKVARLVDKNGMAVILKNNAPKYVVLEYNQVESNEISENDLLEASKKLIDQNRKAYRVLAE
ncbi:MAG: type II toxin-antitoxin system Phd/YefM family antitoxin [Clostridiales bacterium]|nr:type II toxin-antitoxin system Phd/YefM family antitoxin [Clostridiales bacterium]